MSFVLLLLVGVAVAGALVLLGVARSLWTLAGAALMLGAAGFTWQGARHLPDAPRRADVTPIPVEPGLIAFREAIFAPSRVNSLALASADARLQAGDARAAIEGLRREIALRPSDAVLWTALGYTLALHDRAVSPAAKFAFRRAVALAPGTPGPPFFIGLAQLEAGDLAAARAPWAYALARTPANAPYRGDIADRVAAIDQFLKLPAARQAPGTAR